ncbi:MAG: metalloregulator ArsR/SmtB family transcription factor [Pseudomonadales bacterium]|jgi:DNA-binding transcriptional ArsR family regulator|nr:metalloregulator ArsR/SmtB family transcription factor [Pseudomonadales bacterium]
MTGVAVDQVFSALADATRRHLLEIIADHGPISASTLAVNLDISRQAIVKHLQLLEQAGLVSRKRHGKQIRFTVEAHQLAATGRWLQRMAQRWESDALQKSL